MTFLSQKLTKLQQFSWVKVYNKILLSLKILNLNNSVNFWDFDICAWFLHVIITVIDLKIAFSNMGSYDAPSFISEVVSKWHTQHLAQNQKRRPWQGWVSHQNPGNKNTSTLIISKDEMKQNKYRWQTNST